MKPTISIVVPTFNEVENIELLCKEIHKELNSFGLSSEIIIVDDNSSDGTALKAANIDKKFGIKLIRRAGVPCLAKAVLEGFHHARGDILVVMDADLSHPPDSLPKMLEPVLSGSYDASVGSRYIAGASYSGWPQSRFLISRAACLLSSKLTGLSDPMSGFMAIRASVFRRFQYRPLGWKIVLEILTRSGARFIEVPIAFSDRIAGNSKMNPKVPLLFFAHICRLYLFKIRQSLVSPIVGKNSISVISKEESRAVKHNQ